MISACSALMAPPIRTVRTKPSGIALRAPNVSMKFIVPYIRDKSTWPLKPDVLYHDEWPVRHPSLLFAGLHFGDRTYLDTWQALEADPKTFEVLRNLPLRHPLLWVKY